KPRQSRDYGALVALVVVEQLRWELQRCSSTKEAVSPGTHEHFAVALLLPDEVINPVNLGQAVHGLVPSRQAVEKGRFDAGVGLIRNTKGQAGFGADISQHGAQIRVA